ncbi:MAG: VanZ family protein [Anaerolineae bacterium]|jgi:VanZ family protein
MTAGDWLRRHPGLGRWAVVLAWMGLIFFLSAQPDLPRPESDWLDLLISGGAHFGLYGVLAFLLSWALGGSGRGMALAFGLALLYGVSDEFHQSFVPGRVPDVMDLLWDGLGALAGVAAWSLLRRVTARD